MNCQEDGKPVGFMQCHKCDRMEVRQPMDITAEQIEKEGKATIMRMKEHFKEQG